MTMRNQLLAFFVFASCTAAQATSLSPTDRAALLKGTNDSCLENQVKDTTNKAMTVGQLQTYCDCYARAFSDYMQIEDLDKNKDSLTPETQKKAGEFSQACAASTLRK
jgi:hypothetical protein